jgi:hypothetical protein
VLEYGTACHSEPQVKNLERSKIAGLLDPSFLRMTAVHIVGQKNSSDLGFG